MSAEFAAAAAEALEVEITPEQWQGADDMIEILELSPEQAGATMRIVLPSGAVHWGEVRYGLALCGEHMTGFAPDQLRRLIDAGIKAAESSDAPRS